MQYSLHCFKFRPDVQVMRKNHVQFFIEDGDASGTPRPTGSEEEHSATPRRRERRRRGGRGGRGKGSTTAGTTKETRKGLLLLGDDLSSDESAPTPPLSPDVIELFGVISSDEGEGGEDEPGRILSCGFWTVPTRAIAGFGPIWVKKGLDKSICLCEGDHVLRGKPGPGWYPVLRAWLRGVAWARAVGRARADKS